MSTSNETNYNEALEEAIKTCPNCLWYLNKRYCGIAKGRSRKEALAIYEYKGNEICTDFRANRKKLDKPEISEALNQFNNKFVFKVPTDTGEILGYNNGIYIPFKCKIKQFLEEQYEDRINRSFVAEILAHIQRGNFIERKEMNVFNGKIPLENGFFDINTRELTPFNKEHVFTYKLNMIYNEKVTSSKFLEVFEQIQPEKDSQKQKPQMKTNSHL